MMHDWKRIWGTSYSFDDNVISFEGYISFVSWKPECIHIGKPFKGKMHGNFLIIAEDSIVRLRLGTSLPTGDPDPNLWVFHFLKAILGSMTFSATG
jgi:hypothetical protein